MAISAVPQKTSNYLIEKYHPQNKLLSHLIPSTTTITAASASALRSEFKTSNNVTNRFD